MTGPIQATTGGNPPGPTASKQRSTEDDEVKVITSAAAIAARCSWDTAAATAAGVALGVASSSSTDWLQTNLARLGLLARFGGIVGSDQVGGIGKPAPDVYLKACADLGVEPSVCVALEDSAHGISAAQRAGMWAVAVPSRITLHNNFATADLVVDSLTNLPLERLASLVEHAPR